MAIDLVCRFEVKNRKFLHQSSWINGAIMERLKYVVYVHQKRRSVVVRS